jgi:lipopolysaccharide export system permease protein
MAEFHGRLVRIFSVIGVALMSIPLGVTRKRAPVWPRAALGLAVLVALDQILQTVQSLAGLGRIDPAIGLWGVWAVFTLGCAWIYATTPGQGSPSPLRGVLRRIDTLFADAAARGRRLAGWLGIGS